MAKITIANIPQLSNRELQNIAGDLVRQVYNDPDIPLSQKARDIHHLGAIHLRGTRAEVYGIRTAIALGKNTAPNLVTKLKMAIYKP